MQRIGLLGSANALKPKIIIETLVEMQLLGDKELVFFTENNQGICAQYCNEINIEVVTLGYTSLEEKQDILKIKEANCDILISCGWPNKIPLNLFNLFKFTPINCHGSILPDYRGSRAYMHYWANCEEFYGASIHYMNEKFDDGNVIIQGRFKLFLDETPEILHRRTAELCAYLLPKALTLVEEGYLGTTPIGIKRYFFKLTHDEFVKYRNINIYKQKDQRILTPHKNI